ncbi:hypothetical protein HMPREF0872_03375 [Veillonella montpellierensis DNF00314]|uniref:Uncharacterized protein n=1 Tax=Veillonella montpellierensis DNF00314 TaxID=1401067 RepID=A0A096AM87_9FIRM|nr:hypothetical protein [Veillonella montpellierensis]KGF47756.1 hypothetical protein HMPREF0872_03375 [Veillonella montpellierensis DNF00314]
MRIFYDKQGNYQLYKEWQDEVVRDEPEDFKFAEVEKLPDNSINTRFIDGAFVEIEEEKPSLLEQKKQKIAQIKAKYNDKFNAYENALLRARLDDNDSQVKKLQELYRADKLKMVAEIKGA